MSVNKSETPEWDQPERWARAIPRKPKIPHSHRLQLATEWLEALECKVTNQRVNKLAAVVMRYHPLSPKGQCANELVKAGAIPYRKSVEDEYPYWKQRVLERNRQKGYDFLAQPGAVERVCDAIAEYRLEYGVGPLWREVMYAVGLRSPDTVEVVLRELKEQGAVTFTTEPRSLAVIGTSAEDDYSV